ncbi:MAG: hypothetical protein ACD_13C00113G0003 [uncultured bacterium]|uniref:Uncharacterized protein n=1 Tax=Candidatus Woesebacteria bacterium GW2011_GWA1_40_43 TaxID=1618553 RepID=A0A0G0VMI2_9BACT|nr:MAG: hypothetical protein ACD_13C00113G0003 [uncultured bacterium]KKR52793.1 MAG: hypothetical protein UT88_C0021G0008 [Candidatus Woesebacteria bacterium GW2011_GWD2_40_19]KKR56369.1 MAG: hypothetical protein UT96_C0047G0007 [Candidatus Woesebacteria bacterium GW2011_GWC2_40_30]KKR64007.1 MAG: hypothetical protein UU02_C0014G0009 [Candidatus Woesebacteria bacterium GW2011_GWA1_40_43]HAU65142.1 hypothetical protein [Candidatus Woesebacteria bacterium]
MRNLLADNIRIAPEGGFKGFGTLGTVQDQGFMNLATFISMVIGVMTVVAIIWFLFTLITGAISIIGSGGDKQALESARKKITTGVVGLVVVIASIFILDLIGTIFGIDFLDIFSLLGKIQIFQSQ